MLFEGIPDSNNDIGFGFFALNFACNNVGSFYNDVGVFQQPFIDLSTKKIDGAGVQFREEVPDVGNPA